MSTLRSVVPKGGDGVSAHEAARRVGIPYQTLDRWTRQGLIKPSIARACGRGRNSGRRYSNRDLVLIRVLDEVRRHGVAVAVLQSLGKCFLLSAATNFTEDGSYLVVARGQPRFVPGGRALRRAMRGEPITLVIDVPQLVYATQYDLFGTNMGGRPGELATK